MSKMIRPRRSALPVACVVAAAFVGGCGGSTHANSPAPKPIATMVARSSTEAGTGPTALGGSRTPSHRTAPHRAAATEIGTGKHDHLGESCSGRDEARYAGEGMFCVAGRLELKSQVPYRTSYRPGQLCSLRSESSYLAAGLKCVKGRLLVR